MNTVLFFTPCVRDEAFLVNVIVFMEVEFDHHPPFLHKKDVYTLSILKSNFEFGITFYC